jgi:hypothetical protein
MTEKQSLAERYCKITRLTASLLLQTFLISAGAGGKRLASHAGRSTPEENETKDLWICGRQGVIQRGSGRCRKEKSLPVREHDPLARSLVTILTENGSGDGGSGSSGSGSSSNSSSR